MPQALMVTSSFLPGRGGIESYLAELCAELSPQLAVMAPARREGRPIPGDLPYETYGHGGSMLVPSKRVARAVIDRARQLGTDRVLFGTPWPLVLIGPRLRRAGIRYATIVHGAEMLVPSALPIVKSRLARSLSLADLLLPVSRYTGRQLHDFLRRRGYQIQSIEVLRARVDVERFHPQAATPGVRARFGLGEGPLLLSFGRLVKRKGIDRVIAALVEIRRRVPDATLVVAGTGPETNRLRRLARRLDAPVVFLGRIADDDAAALYATADVFVLPVADRHRGLEIEGLGVVLLEAGAAETPSVTGRSGGTPEAVIDGKTGFVINARDGKQLAEAASGLLADGELREKMGRAARTHVERNFSDGRIPEALLNWLGDVR